MSDMPRRKIPFGKPLVDQSDRAAVLAALDNPILTHGDRCTAFEKAFVKFVGGGHAVTTSSCTAALHLFGMHLGLKEGDEVIVPAISHVATSHSIEVTGARPVFVDCEVETGNIDITSIAEAVTQKTRAIALVHFNGIPADMGGIMDLANKYDLPVLEDCATSLGGKWDGVHVGQFGDAAAFSFYPAKHITSAEGGMFLSRYSSVEQSVRRLRAFSYDRTLNERKLPGIYDVDGLGLNYRMSELQAALGQNQLERADSFLQSRAKNFMEYKERLFDTEILQILEPKDLRAQNAFYCLTLKLREGGEKLRNQILEQLPARGVGVSVHYPHPLPRLAYYQDKYGYQAGNYSNAEAISDTTFNLPLGPHLQKGDIEYVCENLVSLF